MVFNLYTSSDAALYSYQVSISQRVSQLLSRCDLHTEIYKRNLLRKSVDGVIVPDLCTLPDYPLYLYQVLQRISKGFSETDLGNSVDVRVVENVAERTYGWTNYKFTENRIPILCHAEDRINNKSAKAMAKYL